MHEQLTVAHHQCGHGACDAGFGAKRVQPRRLHAALVASQNILELRQDRRHRLEPGPEVQQPGLRQEECGPFGHDVRRQLPQTALDREKSSRVQRRPDALLDQRRCARQVAGCQCVGERFVNQAVRREPISRAAMQLRDLRLSEPATQPIPQGILEQSWIPIPAAGFADRLDQALVALEQRQQGVASSNCRVWMEQRIAQLGTDSVQDRRSEQEILCFRRLEGQHLVQQQLFDKLVASILKLCDPCNRVRLLLQHQRRQAEADRPPVGSHSHGRDGLGRQLRLRRRREKRLHFVGLETGSRGPSSTSCPRPRSSPIGSRGRVRLASTIWTFGGSVRSSPPTTA